MPTGFQELKAGRGFAGRLETGTDLVEEIERFCAEQGVVALSPVEEVGPGIADEHLPVGVAGEADRRRGAGIVRDEAERRHREVVAL